jgi:P-type Cu2+ transporter
MTPAEAAARIACAHCGLTVPASREAPEGEASFCCDGCATVYAAIEACGLTRYYEMLQATGEPGTPTAPSGRSYTELDDPAFLSRAAEPTAGGLSATELYLEGVHCAACVWLVEKVPTLVAGVAEVRLDLSRSKARVVWDPGVARLSEAARALDRLGYPVHPYRAARVAELRRKEDRALLIKIGVAGAIAGNVMAIAFALYGGILHGIEPEFLRLFRWTSLVLTVPSVFWCGGVFFRGAIGALRARTLHMDVPVALALAAAFAQGAWNTIRGGGEVYFDAACVLVFLLLAGRFIQIRRQRAAAEAAELLTSLAPSVARVIEGGAVREVPVETLLPGMRIEVRAGETLPADGTVAAGHSSLDLSLLTGESRPVEARRGDAVHAGTVALSGRLEVDVSSAGEETRVGRLMRLVEDHVRRRAPVVQLADRIAGRFVAAVLVLAAATFAVWWRISPQQAFDNAIALLIVTCPCALGLATPLALAAAVGRAAKAGFLVRGADAIEALSRGGTAILDKTGTLTEGNLAVVAWVGSEEAFALAAAVEAHSSHPIARALAAATPAAFGPVDVVETRGGGVAARVELREVVVGSPEFIARAVGAIPTDIRARAEEWSSAGLTPILIAIDGAVVAAAGLGDPVRPDGRDAVARLRSLGWAPRILSGDHASVVAAVAGELGIEGADASGGVSPEAKLDAVLAAKSAGPVMMVGDGVNDAAALAAASVGVAVHGGAEAALAAADVFVTRPGVGRLVELVEGAKRTMHVVRRNLGLSLAYNVVGVALAMAGYIDPMIAAIMMPVSSLTVVISSAFADTFRRPGGV